MATTNDGEKRDEKTCDLWVPAAADLGLAMTVNDINKAAIILHCFSDALRNGPSRHKNDVSNKNDSDPGGVWIDSVKKLQAAAGRLAILYEGENGPTRQKRLRQSKKCKQKIREWIEKTSGLHQDRLQNTKRLKAVAAFGKAPGKAGAAFGKVVSATVTPNQIAPPATIAEPQKVSMSSTAAGAAPQHNESVDANGSEAPFNGSLGGLNCYICKEHYDLSKRHDFYPRMCQPCGEFNYQKRQQTADLRGYYAVVTGGRVKIGFEIALKLLRAGCHVTATTRFPNEARLRYAAMTDYDSFKDRLKFEAIDLRFTNDVEKLCAHLRTKLPRLDILINNAAQTIRRPPQFYAHLLPVEKLSIASANPTTLSETSLIKSDEKHQIATMEKSMTSKDGLSFYEYGVGTMIESVKGLSAAEKTQLVLLPEDRAENNVGCFPVDQYDEHCQQVDLRKKNSWILRPEELTAIEMGETQIVNAISPFLLLQGLLPLLKHAAKNPIRNSTQNSPPSSAAASAAASSSGDKNGVAHVVMVSAMEGVFNRHRKDTNHLHTNMAKAAMNMITRCLGTYYALDHNVLINSVDTGWIDDMTPISMPQKDGEQKKKRFTPPLNDVDGAARVLDPVFLAINQHTAHHGTFFKDYKPAPW